MSETGTKEWIVEGVREGATEPNPHGGELQKFYVDFEGSPDTYWRRRTGDVPEVGRSYYGTISNGEYGPIFKKEKPPQGSASGSRSTKEWKPEAQFDPEKTARIGRAHAQEMALRWLSVHGHAPEDQEGLVPIIDWFENDVSTAGQVAAQGAGISAGSPPALAKAGASGWGVQSGPAPEQPPAEFDLTEIEQALDAAGLASPQARSRVCSYMVAELSPERLSNAIRKLTGGGPDQTSALEALTKLTEDHYGEPLPESVPADDDIPILMSLGPDIPCSAAQELADSLEELLVEARCLAALCIDELPPGVERRAELAVEEFKFEAMSGAAS